MGKRVFTKNRHKLRRFTHKKPSIARHKLYRVFNPLVQPVFIVSFDGHYSEAKQTAGWGFVVYHDDQIFHREHGSLEASELNSHRVEWRACLEALRWIHQNANSEICELRGDSQSVIDMLVGNVFCSDTSLEQIISTAHKLWVKLPHAYARWVRRQENADANAECRKVRLAP